MSQVYSFIPCTCMSELFILLVSVSRSWCCVSCSWCICNQTFSIYSKYIHKTLSYTQRDFPYMPYHQTLYIRKPIHPGYLCLPDQPQHTTFTVCHFIDICTLHLHDYPDHYRGEREWLLRVREREGNWKSPFPKFGNGKGIEKPIPEQRWANTVFLTEYEYE